MKRLSFLILLISLSNQLSAQEFNYKNNVQLELGGHGLAYSLNYERIIFDQSKWKTTAQFGMAYYPPFVGFIDLWLPMSINQIYKIGLSHHIEGGLGIIKVYSSTRDADNQAVDWSWDTFFSARLGYRYQKPDSRFLWRIGITPIMETDYLKSEYYIPKSYRKIISDFHFMAAFSVGYSF
ncbi:hypothetical protein QYS48_06820 [Marivirga arenosa]|uniref:Outer membrane protein beta-barrel domain-containing protein n=1 Tax=Marivirga arenosa TaxID=3059076 RepID=A0AA49GH27_9BACT|nr:hypothetical protein [Marivirga sp. ABR2-2]WKK86617.1 hypothetical protein QYS48_06820 [Marivirga sp. ABR2-2]